MWWATRFGAIIISVGLMAGCGSSGGSTQSSTTTALHLTSVSDVCNRFYEDILRAMREQMTDDEIRPELRVLADASESADVVAATDIRAAARPNLSPAEVSVNTLVVLRRCAALGSPMSAAQQAELQRLAKTPLPAP